MTQQGNEAVYEMMWDCKYCGQKKLLGLTHRFCANCGGPQDPAARYFPPENEKVAVKDHPFVGADVTCPACKQPMGRAAKCCTNCGSPIDKGAEVARRADIVIPPPVQAAGAGPAKSNVGLILGIIGGVLVLVLVVGLVMAFWKREGVFVVTGKTWERSIEVQRFETGRKTAWCDAPPAGGRELSRRKEQKGTEKVQDGETCGTRKKDLGNGTYKEVKECTPKYRDEPVMAYRCEYEVTEWRKARALEAKGTDDAPRWPDATLSATRQGSCVGCEREGPRAETYAVQFVDEKSKKDASCELPQAKWASFAKGSKWKGKVRVATGGLDCDGLVRP